ncbi:C40 family peptidase [Streptomyces gobiensis]|uniref:C40 family peptidase n=1 Tax=Streptomyces gobiensis TaxID=2875706 RepID=UPI001E644CB9|nr:C40 family peptidase [Streptomyces gobiensis]UGY92968.1 C40 family peptidase [Streptomyces gobiensis]
MSAKPHIRSHRKPRRSSGNTLLRTGVAGGVLSTLAVTGSASPASAESKSPVDTVEMPTLGSALASTTTQAAHATQSIAIQYELDAVQTAAAKQAQEAAAKAKKKADAEAKKKAAEAAAAAAAARKAEAEREAKARAARSAERSALSGAPSAPSTSPGSGNAASVVNFARAQVGKAYVMGATGPNAYDCSGLTTAAFKQVGVSLPRTSQAQSSAGTEVGLSNLQPGDVLYWGGKGSATHVAIYIGNGKYVGAQNPSSGVAEHELGWGGTPSGAVRFL